MACAGEIHFGSEEGFNLVLEILLFDGQAASGRQPVARYVSISYSRFFSLMVPSHYKPNANNASFNLVLEILLFDGRRN